MYGFKTSVSSNNRKPLTLSGSVDMGSYFIGNKQEYLADISWRVPGLGSRRIPRLYLSGNLRHIISILEIAVRIRLILLD